MKKRRKHRVHFRVDAVLNVFGSLVLSIGLEV